MALTFTCNYLLGSTKAFAFTNEQAKTSITYENVSKQDNLKEVGSPVKIPVEPVDRIDDYINPSKDITPMSSSDQGGGGGYIDGSIQPPPSIGFKKDKKTNEDTKSRNPKSGSYGYKDSKGNYWVPNNTMDGGPGYVREWPDGSHDHVYPNGNVRKHSGKGAANFSAKKIDSSGSWLKLGALGFLLVVTIISPIPGDEVLVGAAILGY